MYLNCKTYFSFRYGTYGTEELIKEAVEKGITSLALTNINNTCDAWDFVDYCIENNIKPIVGAEIRNDEKFMYILLAKNIEGLRRINEFLSNQQNEKHYFPERFTYDKNVFVIYPLTIKTENENEFIGVNTNEINKLYNCNDFSKMVMLHPVTFQNKTYYNVHRLLRAIDKNVILSKQDKKDIASPHEVFITPATLINAFKQYPSIVTNTLQLLDQCKIEISFHTDKSKNVFTSNKESDKLLLEKLALDGFLKRYGKKNVIAQNRLIKELRIIDEMNFNAYFLITWDLIRYATSRGFYYVGRGSGANSIVAYCLQITDVDPIELDLYFERFLNPHRTVPPDFDMDFSWKDRDEIIDYIFKRYGKNHVCLLGSYVTFQKRAIIRELGKVFGLPKEEIDTLENGIINNDKIHKQIHQYGNLIMNFPNQLSIHACGMLISEKPLFYYTATEMPPKGFSTSQIDMFIAEKIGLYKIDILSQRGLGHIKDTIEIVRENRKIDINIHEVEKFKKDTTVAEKIRSADTIGCFYIESPAMRQLLLKLRCDNYITLVAASSIIRPGVSQSGMMKQYIYRFHHPDSFEYLHPKMKELLQETYGVMVYQEDVIKVAHHFAGLDMSEADVLRRAMSGKYRSKKQFEQITKRFFDNCKSYGYSDDLTKEVWRQIESFGGYSFSKAHSASFAVESYQSLYLKTYFPKEFMVAVINNFGGFYSTELYFHELKKTGAVIHLPCVNKSERLTRIENNDVFIGFIHIQGLEEKTLEIIENCKKESNFLHIQDFVERVDIGMEQLNLLIRIGAFRFTLKNKKELLWEANFLHKKNEKHTTGITLFIEKPLSFSLPVLRQLPSEDAMDEIELLGFPVCNVFDLVDANISLYVEAKNIKNYLGKNVSVIGFLITSKPVRTIKQDTMYFHTFIDAAGDWLDTVFFPDAAKYYNVTGRGFYEMQGKVIEEFGVFIVDVHQCKRIQTIFLK
jgi:DNA polymerase III alpha subunit